jgi:3-mercaptopyruvate sulfurtransferase SseA
MLMQYSVTLLHCRTFKAFGHDAVHILNGGLPAWIAANQQVDSGSVVLQSTRPSTGLVQKGGNTWLLKDKGFKAKLQPHMVRTLRQV